MSFILEICNFTMAVYERKVEFWAVSSRYAPKQWPDDKLPKTLHNILGLMCHQNLWYRAQCFHQYNAVHNKRYTFRGRSNFDKQHSNFLVLDEWLNTESCPYVVQKIDNVFKPSVIFPNNFLCLVLYLAKVFRMELIWPSLI